MIKFATVANYRVVPAPAITASSVSRKNTTASVSVATTVRNWLMTAPVSAAMNAGKNWMNVPAKAD